MLSGLTGFNYAELSVMGGKLWGLDKLNCTDWTDFNETALHYNLMYLKGNFNFIIYNLDFLKIIIVVMTMRYAVQV